MKIGLTAAAIVFIGGIIGFFCLGGIVTTLICLPLLMIAIPFLAVFAGWAALSLKRTGEAHRTAKALLAVFSGICLLLATIAASGCAWEKFFVSEAMKFPQQIESALAQYQMEHGHCPDSLQELPGIWVPRLLRGEDCYRSDGAHYTLSFLPPSAFLSGWEYDSRSGRWSNFD